MTTFLGHSLPLPPHPLASYTRDKSYKKLHSCHFSRNESSRKIFLRHHCRSCESLRGKKKKKKNKKGRGREERLSLSILDLYSEKPKMCRIKSNDLINEEKMEVELKEKLKDRDFDSYIFNNN